MVSTFSPGVPVKGGRLSPLKTTSIVVGLFCGLVIFVGNAVLSYRSTSGFIDASRSVLTAYQLRHDVSEVHVDLRDMQRAVSSYAITRDPAFLASYRTAKEKLDRDVTVLSVAARGGSSHARMATQIGELAAQVRSNLEEEVTLCDQGRCTAAAESLRSGPIRQLMDGAGAIARAADADLENVLREERQAAGARERRARLALVLGALLGSVLLFAGFVFVLLQMARRDRAARALAESERRLSMIIDTIRDGLTYSDDRGKFEIFNPAMAEICGYSAEEANGAPDFSQLLHPDPAERARALEGMCEVMETGQTIGRETVIVTKKGDRKDLLVSSAIVRSGGRTYFLTTYHDVTARRQSEREREKLIQQLQSALADVKTLRGLLPICGWCKKIRDDGGYYHRIEAYITAHSEAKFTHGICPDCAKKFEEDLAHGS
jgi:PAS domain S-box-containing protein